jgi:hypothetical protein
VARFLLNILPRINRKKSSHGPRTGSRQEEKRGKSEMADKKDTDKEFDTCFENWPFAELMQKMMGRQGVGSLCAEIMEKILEEQKDGGGAHGAGIMRAMASQSSRVQEEPEETKEEESHVKSER